MGAGSLPTGVVTLVFTDIEGSTQLLHELGERYGELLAEHHRVLRGVWAEHGGVEVRTEGDAFFVAFTSARAAVDAARDAQHALASSLPGLRVRAGLHTGEPEVRDGDYWGIDVHYAARLCSAAHGGQVLLSATTRALIIDAEIDDLGEHTVKDFPTPRSLFQLVTDGHRAGDFPPPRTLERARTNLPSMLTPLVGRDRELADLVHRLTGSDARLVTLTGSGGSGKTKLAIASAAELLDRFADGVFLVALAPVGEPAGVLPALADTVDPRGRSQRDEATLIERLKDKQMLLVIDNFEHVIEAAPLVARLIDRTSRLRLLVTSQAPLRLAAETVVPLEPLAVPDHAAHHDPDALSAVASVSLFLDRVRAADPSFVLTADDAGTVAELCRALDGLPLALELAAARVRMAGVQGVLDALGRGIDSLGRGTRDLPARQRGLAAALGYTVSLLEDQPRELFAGLGAFADTWAIDDAEWLLGDELDVWESMSVLLDLSLIRRRGDGRLTMAERVKVHARDLLAGGGREPELRTRHAELMADKAAAIGIAELVDFAGTLARSREIVDELERALAWARATDQTLYRRLLGNGGRVLRRIGRIAPLIREIEQLSDQEDGADVASGEILLARAAVENTRADLPAATQWCERGVACHRRTADLTRLLATMAAHVVMLAHEGDAAGARVAIADALELAPSCPDPRFSHLFQGMLAVADMQAGRFEQAEQALAELMRHGERTDFAAVSAISYLADCAVARGDGAAALDRYLAALDTTLADEDLVSAVLQLAGIAASLSLLGRDSEAARIGTATEHVGRELDTAIRRYGIAQVLDELDGLERRVGAEEWARQRTATSGLTLDDLVAEARALSPACPPTRA